MKLRFRGTVSVAVVVVAVLQVGCATGAKPEAMVANNVAVGRTVGAEVSVSVSGGKQTSSTGASQVSDQAFAQALRESIGKAKLFKAVTESGGQYKLNAFIGKVDQPTMGFSMTVKMEVSYALIDTQSGKTVWSKNVASEHTAKPSEAFAGIERLRLANEGAAKANIEQAIGAISALEL